MQESLSPQIGIYESRLRAQAPESEPQKHELGVVGAVQRDDLILANAMLLLQPRRIFQHCLVHLRIGPFIAFQLGQLGVGFRGERLFADGRRNGDEGIMGSFVGLGIFFEGIEEVYPVSALPAFVADGGSDDGGNET